MRMRFVGSQYKVLSKYCEDLSKASVLATVGGYFMPSLLPSSLRPTITEAAFGGIFSVFFLVVSLYLIKKGGK